VVAPLLLALAAPPIPPLALVLVVGPVEEPVDGPLVELAPLPEAAPPAPLDACSPEEQAAAAKATDTGRTFRMNARRGM
jgi:hypothetical protein